MEITHQMAGLLISLAGALLALMAGPIPRTVNRLHVHALESLESIEPAMLTWVMRAIGFAVFMLGIVTLANAG